MYIFIYICVYIYIYTYRKTSFLSPNRSRTKLPQKILDRSTPNSVPRLFRTLQIMEMQRKCNKIKQTTHLQLQLLVKSMKMDLGWCFWDPKPVLRMPGGPYQPLDASNHVPNPLKLSEKGIRSRFGPPASLVALALGNPIIYWYTWTHIYVYIHI